MSTVLIASILWVFAGTITALLPMRHQFVIGVPLLLSAPVLIVALTVEYGWWLFLLSLFAFLSMFRRPLRYFAWRGWKRLTGRAGE